MYPQILQNVAVPPCDAQEVMTYAGVRQPDPGILTLLRECQVEANPVLRYKLCWMTVPLHIREDELDFGWTRVQSRSLAGHLAHCHRVVLFGATIGLEIDRLIARYGLVQPSKALMLESYGSERIEALCDAFCEWLAKDLSPEETLCSRFSPGYGDLPLGFQQELIQILDCSRQIGLSLTASLMMTPAKSVTALVGIKKVRPPVCKV